MNILAFCLLILFSNHAQSFSVRRYRMQRSVQDGVQRRMADATSTNENLFCPISWDEMVRQASSAIRKGRELGTNKQIVRILLPRDGQSGKFGEYLEGSSQDSQSMVLVPPDESWQGGILQLYRACAPTAEKILRQVTSSAGLPPRITEDRSVDESGVDGVGLLMTDDKSVHCWVQPTQENIDGIEQNALQISDEQTVILLNPQWRQVDDALDSASKGEGFLSNFASFLGGKGGTLKRLAAAGFKPVYTLEGYVCRGANVRLLQTLDSDWFVFCQRDDGESYVSVGSTSDRPTYQQVDSMLQGADIGYKYARDMGFQPKL